MARKFNYEDLPSSATAEDILEIDINRSIVAYDALSRFCRPALVNNKPTVINGEAAEAMLKQVVFFGDARARKRGIQPDTPEALLWVEEAREGIVRMSYHFPAMEGLEDARLFTSHSALQEVLYNEMCKHRTYSDENLILASSSLDYGDRVALREIDLAPTPQQSLT